MVEFDENQIKSLLSQFTKLELQLKTLLCLVEVIAVLVVFLLMIQHKKTPY